jgi:adenosine deaminase
VGHGVRLADLIEGAQGAAVLQEVRERCLHLEVCPTSNVQTGAAASIAAHPIRALWQAGVSLSFHTDNRLISRTSASREAALLVIEAGLTWADLQRMSLLAAQASFLPDHLKDPALSRIQDWSCPAA